MLFNYLLYFFFLLATVVARVAPPLANSREIHSARLLVSPVCGLLSDVPGLVLAGFFLKSSNRIFDSLCHLVYFRLLRNIFYHGQQL